MYVCSVFGFFSRTYEHLYVYISVLFLNFECMHVCVCFSVCLSLCLFVTFLGSCVHMYVCLSVSLCVTFGVYAFICMFVFAIGFGDARFCISADCFLISGCCIYVPILFPSLPSIKGRRFDNFQFVKFHDCMAQSHSKPEVQSNFCPLHSLLPASPFPFLKETVSPSPLCR